MGAAIKEEEERRQSRPRFAQTSPWPGQLPRWLRCEPARQTAEVARCAELGELRRQIPKKPTKRNSWAAWAWASAVQRDPRRYEVANAPPCARTAHLHGGMRSQ